MDGTGRVWMRGEHVATGNWRTNRSAEAWGSGRFKGRPEEGSEKAPERVTVYINLNAAVMYEGLGSVKDWKPVEVTLLSFPSMLYMLFLNKVPSHPVSHTCFSFSRAHTYNDPKLLDPTDARA